MFANEVRLLHLVGDVFFDTVQSLFPIRAVGKCRMAFTLLMKDFGTGRACDQVENYIRRRKTLYHEMVAYDGNGGLDCANAAKRYAEAKALAARELAFRESGVMKPVLVDETPEATARFKTFHDFADDTSLRLMESDLGMAAALYCRKLIRHCYGTFRSTLRSSSGSCSRSRCAI